MPARIILAIAVLVVLAALALLTLRSGGEPDLVGRPDRPTTGIEAAPAPSAGANGDSPGVDIERRGDHDFDAIVATLSTGTGIVGRVTGPDGTSAAGAAVWLVRTDRDERIGSTTADGQGRFALELGHDDDFDQTTFRVAAHQAAFGFARPVVVERPAAGAVARVDLVLADPGRGISGTLRGPGGAVVPAHEIVLTWLEGPPRAGPEWRDGRDDAEVVTDGNGRFVARGLRGGRFELDCGALLMPLGFDDPPSSQFEAEAGSVGLVFDLAFVRLDVQVMSERGVRRVAEHLTARVHPPSVAAEAASRVAASGSAEIGAVSPLPVWRDDREQVDAARFAVAPGAFAILSASVDGVSVQAGVAVPLAAAVVPIELRIAPIDVTGGLWLTVLGPRVGVPERVLFRALRDEGVPFAPPGLVDLGGGWHVLPADGLVPLVVGAYRVELLGDPIEAAPQWLADELEPQQIEVEVAPGAAPLARTVRFATGAYIELELDAAADPTDAAIDSRMNTRLDDGTPMVRSSGAVTTADGTLRALRLAIGSPSAGWRAVPGIPHRPGEHDTLRVLGTFAPGPARFEIQTWRPATSVAARGTRLTLVPGRNPVRCRLDRDAVIEVVGG